MVSGFDHLADHVEEPVRDVSDVGANEEAANSLRVQRKGNTSQSLMRAHVDIVRGMASQRLIKDHVIHPIAVCRVKSSTSRTYKFVLPQ